VIWDRKPHASVPLNARKSHARVSLKAKNAIEIEMRVGKNVTAIGWPKLQ
jgi:hypothetical protein